jgi:Mrp family chromosome partitioning ATPase
VSRTVSLREKALPVISPHGADPSAVHHKEYAALIQRLFQGRAVVAVMGVSSSEGVTGICEEIASELADLGRRVVVVSVQILLHSSPLAVPNESSFTQGPARNVWYWPSFGGQQVEFFKSRATAGPDNWLDSLRRNFDAVLLDCPSLDTAPGSASIAALAEATVLVVEAAKTPKRELIRTQRALQLSFVKLAGCILTHAK